MYVDVNVEVAVDIKCGVGEAPCWDERDQSLLFVDVTDKIVYRYFPKTEDLAQIQLDRHVGGVIPRSAGGLIAAVQDGIALLDEESGELALVVPIEHDKQDTRMNDVKCDAEGRMWAGTMSYQFEHGAGALYRIRDDFSFEKVVSLATIPNGIGWSLDGNQMYYIESAEQSLDVFDFNPKTGDVANRRQLIDFSLAHGTPDGMTVDSEGYLWVALFGGSRVERFRPDGVLESIVRLPVSQVTSVTFGGSEFEDLYITSARFQLSTVQLETEPLAGATFRCRPGVKGLPASKFAA
jgi:sugar lactone lactonase YvrE